MEKIIAVPNETKTGFHIPNIRNKEYLKELFKEVSKFEIKPIYKETIRGRRFLEGAVIPAWCKFQYGIDPRDRGRGKQRRMLFMRDFNYEIVEDRNRMPVRIPKDTSRNMATKINDKYTREAEECGAPIPNPKLFKLWRDKWSDDPMFQEFYDFLDYLGLECDAMPTTNFLKAILPDDGEIQYPDEYKEKIDPNKTPF